jgi:hypothetical protein
VASFVIHVATLDCFAPMIEVRLALADASIKFVPKMSFGVQIRRLWWSSQCINVVLGWEIHGYPCCMGPGILLLYCCWHHDASTATSVTWSANFDTYICCFVGEENVTNRWAKFGASFSKFNPQCMTLMNTCTSVYLSHNLSNIRSPWPNSALAKPATDFLGGNFP